MIKKESAGGIIINEYNEICMVFTDTLSWQFPKGGVEAGEKYLETAVREIQEETGLSNVRFIKALPMYTRVSTDGSASRDIYYFLFNTEKQPLTPQAEVSKCEWISIDDVEEKLTYNEDRAFFKSVQKEVYYVQKY